MEMGGFVYIMTNKRNGTLYIGVTSKLTGRIHQHKTKELKGFTEKHGLDKLVWYEHFNYIRDAITREKQMKEWKRLWKLRVIEKFNSNWDDLYETL
jgi:putative endonuclease